MNLVELNRALRQFCLGGMAAVLETRLRQAQTEPMAPLDLISCLVSDELTRRADRPLERRRKQAQFRDLLKTFDNFDFTFNKKMNRSLVFELATGAFIARHEDVLFFGPPCTGKSHLVQAIGQAVIQQGSRVFYRETHKLLDDLTGATLDGTRKECLESLVTVPLLIIDDFGMRKLPLTAVEELVEIIMRRYERTRRWSPRTGPSKSGASCWVMPPPRAPCSTASCTTATCSNATCGAGEPKRACLKGSRQVKTIQSRTPPIGRF
jgi:DNA replication protein DnaC